MLLPVSNLKHRTVCLNICPLPLRAYEDGSSFQSGLQRCQFTSFNYTVAAFSIVVYMNDHSSFPYCCYCLSEYIKRTTKSFHLGSPIALEWGVLATNVFNISLHDGSHTLKVNRFAERDHIGEYGKCNMKKGKWMRRRRRGK